MAPSKAKSRHAPKTPSKPTATRSAKPPIPQPPLPKQRARQKCRKCHDVPTHFRSECPVHSRSGKVILLEQQAHWQENVEEPASSPPTPPPSFQPSSAPPQTWDPVTPMRPSRAPSSASKYLLQRAGGMSSPIVIAPSPLRFHQNAPEATPLIPAAVIDPVLLEPPSPVDDNCEPLPDAEMRLLGEITPPPARQSPRKKVIPGEFGHIQNVRDGLKVYKLVRKHKAPEVAESRDLATRNFKRRVKTILESCEDVAINTGACLFFGAYHPTQKSDKIWMYSSPKLISKAPDFAKDTTKSFYSTMRSLADAKRLEVQELQDRIDAEQARAEEAENRAIELENNYERVQAQLAALQAKGPVE